MVFHRLFLLFHNFCPPIYPFHCLFFLVPLVLFPGPLARVVTPSPANKLLTLRPRIFLFGCRPRLRSPVALHSPPCRGLSHETPGAKPYPPPIGDESNDCHTRNSRLTREKLSRSGSHYQVTGPECALQPPSLLSSPSLVSFHNPGT